MGVHHIYWDKTKTKNKKRKLSSVQPLNLRLLDESYKVFVLFYLCWAFFTDFRLSDFFKFSSSSVFFNWKFEFLFFVFTLDKSLSILTFIRLEDES